MKEHFVDKKFEAESLALIAWAEGVIVDHMAQGYTLTVRQLHYQGVKENKFENTKANYKKLGTLIADARMAGIIDWDAIEDRGRRGRHQRYWESPKDAIQQAVEGFKIDKWLDQPYYVEVMVEKQALEGILIPVCDKLQVPFHSNKGYSSVSAMYETGKRLQERAELGRKKLYVIYCGDHDPSGVDMSRDVADRLALFSQSEVTVMRVALNYSQVKRYNLPANFVKGADSRSPKYVDQFGEDCWELDSLTPRVLAGMVEKAVLSLRDENLWQKSCEREDDMQDELDKILSMVSGV